MSLDYPNRKVWLAVRYTPRDLWRKRGRLIWASREQGTHFLRPCAQQRVQDLNRRQKAQKT
jgi:hypothetical protein